MKIYRIIGPRLDTFKMLLIAGVVAISPLLGGVTHAVDQAHIVGTVTNQSGTPLNGVRVTAIDPGSGYLGGQDVYAVTASDGTYDLNVQHAGTYDIIFTESTYVYGAFVAHNVTVQNTQTVDAQLSSETHTITGTIKDENGNPVPNLRVNMRSALNIYGLNYTARTSATGQFTITALAGYYDPLNFGGLYNTVTLDGYSLSSPSIGPWLGARTGVPVMIDLYNGNVTQNIQLSFVKLTVAIKNSAGSPVQGKYAFIRGLDNPRSTTNVMSNGTSYPQHAGPSSYGGYTGADGTYTALVPRGSEYFPGQICVANTSVASYTSCSPGIVPTTNTSIASSDLTILFQGDPIVEQGDSPAIPTNLAVSPFTQEAPSITWDAVPGAESYAIYRNNVRIGSSITSSFIDNDAPTGSQSYTVAAVVGNTESQPSSNVTTIVDRTPPSVTYVQSPAANSNGWNNKNTTITFSCSDRFGVDACPPPMTVSTEGVNQIVSGTATDNAGNTTSTSATVNLDKTPPTISYTLSPAPNANSWNNSDMIVTFNCSDALSGIQTCPSPVTVGTEGVNQTITGTATDKAGNSASVTANANLDKTAPVITASIDGEPNVQGWYGGDVTITYTCSDSLSGIQTCPSPVTVSTEGANQAIVGTAIDNASNTASVTTNLNIDKTLPTIATSVSHQANANGWYNGSVIVSFSCGDALSGILTCSSPVTIDTEGANQAATGTAVDKAGNSQIVTASAINIDKTPPTISYSANPAPNANGWSNSDTTVAFNCNDSLSGVQSCPSPVAVSTEGASQAVVGTATDKADNSTTATAHINLDKTAPTITTSASSQPNANGWYSGDVTITYDCSDALSGIQSCPSPVTVSTEGANQVIVSTATDKDGNSASITTTLNIDKTTPTIVATRTPVSNANGWNNTDVTFSYICSDSLSGISSCSNPVTLSTEGGNLSVTGTAVDKAGNTNDVTVSPIKIDKTPPTISSSTMSSTFILFSANETLSANVSDSLSGIVGGEFYMDTDPGQGLGSAMTYSNGKLNATKTISGLTVGQHKLYMRSKDAAGNWSTVTSVTFTFV